MESLLFWGIVSIVAGVGGWLEIRVNRGSEDFLKYKEYVKAKKDFTKSYFKNEEEARRIKDISQGINAEKISIAFIFVGCMMIFASPFVVF